MYFTFLDKCVDIELLEGPYVAIELLKGLRHLGQYLQGMNETLQAFLYVVGHVEHRSDIDENLCSLRLLIKAVLMTPFHTKKGLLVKHYRFIMELVLLEKIGKLVHHAVSVLICVRDRFETSLKR